MCLSGYVPGSRLRQVLMLAASYAFYVTWGTTFLLILVASSVLNFVIGELLRRRRTLGLLWFGIAGNVLLLAFFKYLPIASSGFKHIVMPIGMSFWTFQALSYLFDIYREEELDPSIVEFCLYMAFWPTVIMGPICRLPRMLPQFRQGQTPSLENISTGVKRIGIGLFMKLVVAQLLGSAMETAGSSLDTAAANLGGLDVWVIAIGFGFRLFFDFAGYSHIVIGAARLFGISVEENFDEPFLATTPSIFWTKWHVSLSFWIRDYVFMPFATLRREIWWRYASLVFSMLLFGLWHGATLTFVLWGLYHGIFQMLYRVAQQHQNRGRNSAPTGSFVGWLVTFVGISLSWILFRSRSLGEAMSMFKVVFAPASYLRMTLPADYYRMVIIVGIAYFAYCGIVQGEKFRDKVRFHFDGMPNYGGLKALLQLLWEQRLWWVTPMVAVLTLFAAATVLLEGSRVTSFIYTVF
jgi:alginate O-acetyltransferase complex protein AlgI